MKIFDGGENYIKSVPAKFNFEDAGDYLSDFDHKRLSEVERHDLEMALFGMRIKEFWKEIPVLVKEQVGKRKPAKARRIKTRSSEYFAIVFGKKRPIEVVCPSYFYNIMPVKETVKRNY